MGRSGAEWGGPWLSSPLGSGSSLGLGALEEGPLQACWPFWGEKGSPKVGCWPVDTLFEFLLQARGDFLIPPSGFRRDQRQGYAFREEELRPAGNGRAGIYVESGAEGDAEAEADVLGLAVPVLSWPPGGRPALHP